MKDLRVPKFCVKALHVRERAVCDRAVCERVACERCFACERWVVEIQQRCQ